MVLMKELDRIPDVDRFGSPDHAASPEQREVELSWIDFTASFES